jgi:hypothetical protein
VAAPAALVALSISVLAVTSTVGRDVAVCFLSLATIQGAPNINSSATSDFTIFRFSWACPLGNWIIYHSFRGSASYLGVAYLFSLGQRVTLRLTAKKNGNEATPVATQKITAACAETS